MPRQQLRADVEAARASTFPSGIVKFDPGSEDGTFVLQYLNTSGPQLELQAMMPDVSEYPNSHSWFVYTTSGDAPQSIDQALDSVNLGSLRISNMLEKLSSTLNKATSSTSEKLMDSDDELEDYAEYDVSDGDDSLDATFYQDTALQNTAVAQSGTANSLFVVLTPAQMQEKRRRARRDLSLAKTAGFRISSCGEVLDGGSQCFINISCRIAKLGIQEDTLKLWHLDPRKYLMLIIRYPRGYQSIEQALRSNTSVEFRMVMTDKFRMPKQQAQFLFADEQLPSDKTREDFIELDNLFIDRPLLDLLNGRLLTLVRLRQTYSLPWNGAEIFYNEHCTEANTTNCSNLPDHLFVKESMPSHLPSLVTDDHLGDRPTQPSLPLVAMQLGLRHLVRCTEFCLVCHSRVPNTFEALKPYVCSNSLCLYQYMQLGFGPSIESEILAQPDVVDLLINFCYSAARASSLKMVPEGMKLIVPPLPGTVGARRMPTSQTQVSQNLITYKGILDKAHQELRLNLRKDQNHPSINPGQWIYISGSGNNKYHSRVREVFESIIFLGPLITANPAMFSRRYLGEKLQEDVVYPTAIASTVPSMRRGDDQTATDPSKRAIHVEFAIWSQHFDSMKILDQQITILSLLDSLPSIQEMRNFIVEAGKKDCSLSSWVDRISQAALGILRWIIASNRSFIRQIDSLRADQEPEEGLTNIPPGWIQFHFAQGAPDKEQRFFEAVRAAKERCNLQYPTIFAWHGSPLNNWHSIIREGLNFDRIVHGRAKGHGVYHSTDLSISTGYSASSTFPRSVEGPVSADNCWPQSALDISMAVCLNELVNVPTEYTNHTGCLVVQHLDWIQTRYLLVRLSRTPETLSRKVATNLLEQDPNYQPISMGCPPAAVKLGIPLSAIPKSRRTLTGNKDHGSGTPPSKKRKIDNHRVASGETMLGEQPLEIEYESDDSLDDEIALYVEDLDLGAMDLDSTASDQHTEFQPGTLARQHLPLLAPPSFATTQASQTLQRELKRTLATQESTPLHELGWYLDPNLVGNLYQWIFELHSFDKSLPLTKDMQESNVNSIVVEVRFNAQYPYSPPFVRVVRPRFLPRSNGGGGHVTYGGAMCMELLTNTGWNPASTIEAIILQVRAAISSTEPSPARLAPLDQRGTDYSINEAVTAFERACQMHGWTVPVELRQMAAARPA